MQTSKQLGMVTLNDALLELVEKREVGPDEAYMKSVEKAGMLAALKQRGHKLTIAG
jgi:twitching motility protein PilT